MLVFQPAVSECRCIGRPLLQASSLPLPCARWLPRQQLLPHFAARCSLLTTQLVSTLFDRRSFFNTHHSFFHSSRGAASSAPRKTETPTKDHRNPRLDPILKLPPRDFKPPFLRHLYYVRLRSQYSVTPQRARVPSAPSKIQRDFTCHISSRTAQHSH
jgi:hypothetical protein